ncbi:MAG: tryptophan synthase subunit alpha [Caulobacteraceae bacterium]
MTTERLNTCFAKLKAEGRAAFVAYVMAGDPDPETAFRILSGLPAAGADIIELGMPFSDPMAEGPPIQRAAQRSLKQGFNVTKTLEVVRRFRQTDTVTPIVLMGYLNPVLSRGYVRFARDAAEAGVDGLIIVDAPPEDSAELGAALAEENLSRIWLAAPTTNDARLKTLIKGASGFVYYVSVAGVTGVKEADAEAVRPAVERVRAASGLPVAVGFGIRTPERAAAVARIADGVVVGSALVDALAAALEAGEDAAPKVLALARGLAQAVRGARKATVEA